MGGGKYNYADAYSKYKAGEVSDAEFEKYVDSQGDLKNAWAQIQSQPGGTQGSYWIPRGATSKAAFGRAHAAEDQALSTGSYHGGTDVAPYTGGTRFVNWASGAGGNGNGGNGNGNGNGGNGWAAARGGGAPGSDMYPMGLVDYEEPSAMSGISRELQPWLQADHIPDSLWNYQPPTLDEWEIARNWDWASKPASEYAPKPPVTTTAPGDEFREGPEGNRDGYNPMNDPGNYMPGHELDPAYYTGPDLNWDASASRKNFDWNNPLGAWANRNIYGMEDSNAMAAQIQAMQTANALADKQSYMDAIDAMTSGTGFDIGEIGATTGTPSSSSGSGTSNVY